MPWTVPRQRLGRDVERAVAPEPHHAAAVCTSPIRRTRGVVPVEDGDAVGREALQDLGLGVGDRVDGGEELEVDRRHVA